MGEEVGRRRGRIAFLAAIALIAVAAIGWAAVDRARSRDGHGHDDGHAGAAAERPLRLGLPGSPLLAPAHLAAARGAPWTAVRHPSGAEVGYALLAGELDAGFVEAGQAAALLRRGSDPPLHVAGAVTFPYGAAVVARKGAAVRLGDLAGKRLAAVGGSCALLAQFAADAEARGLPAGGYAVVTVPFDAMVPALESGAVDAAVLRAAESLIAAKAGHEILYQNWRMQAGDECCPPTVFQAQYVLVARGHHPDLYAAVAALALAAEAPPGELRAAAVAATAFPADVLERFPAPAFALPDAPTRAAFGDGPSHHHH